jgi:hypothetical protein
VAKLTPTDVIGKLAVSAFRTTHFDRAGETGCDIANWGEIVTVENGTWAVVDAQNGQHIRCPLACLYRVRKQDRLPSTPDFDEPIHFFAAEVLIRDFHSAKRPLVLQWLKRPAALRLCKAVL